MAKKLTAVLFLITVVIFSSISIYASQEKPAPELISRETSEEAQLAIAVAAAETQDKVEEFKEKEKKEKYIEGLSAYIRHVNRNVSREESDSMAKSFVKYGRKYDVDEKVVMAVAHTESFYKSNAVSSADYKGLMQTGDGLAENAGYEPQQLFDPNVSIKVGARYLSIKLDEFDDMRLALTAYNQGSGSVHSGNYSTGYADLAMSRAKAVEEFLQENGYCEA